MKVLPTNGILFFAFSESICIILQTFVTIKSLAKRVSFTLRRNNKAVDLLHFIRQGWVRNNELCNYGVIIDICQRICIQIKPKLQNLVQLVNIPE